MDAGTTPGTVAGVEVWRAKLFEREEVPGVPIAPIPMTPDPMASTGDTPGTPPVRPVAGNFPGQELAPGVTNSMVPVRTLGTSKATVSLVF